MRIRICHLEPPDGLASRYLFADAVVLVHKEVCRDLATGRLFSTEPTSFLTAVHESGHRPFGLADEYDRDGGYFTSDIFPNLFSSEEACNADAATVPGAYFRGILCSVRVKTPSRRSL
jgi:hypothetical protein